jgi:hypothetical protein
MRIHAAGVNPDEQDEHIDAALLGEPEAQRRAPQPKLVQPRRKHNTDDVRRDEPDAQQRGNQAHIRPPVCVKGIVRTHRGKILHLRQQSCWELSRAPLRIVACRVGVGTHLLEARVGSLSALPFARRCVVMRL